MRDNTQSGFHYTSLCGFQSPTIRQYAEFVIIIFGYHSAAYTAAYIFFMRFYAENTICIYVIMRNRSFLVAQHCTSFLVMFIALSYCKGSPPFQFLLFKRSTQNRTRLKGPLSIFLLCFIK